jgi:exopolyphosphatase
MTISSSNGVFKRELLVWGFNEKGAEAARKFEERTRGELGLETWNNGSLDLVEKRSWRRCWRQGKVEQSRKQVAPLLRAASL